MKNIFKKIYFRALIFFNIIINKNFLKKLMVNKITKNGIEIIFQVNNIISLNRSIFYYEKETLDWIETFRKERFLGYWCLYRRLFNNSFKKEYKSFAFEVDYPTYKLCKKNFEINKINEFSKVFNVLIGEETRLVNLDINDVAAISKTPIINSKNDNFIMSFALDDLINFKGLNHLIILKLT